MGMLAERTGNRGIWCEKGEESWRYEYGRVTNGLCGDGLFGERERGFSHRGLRREDLRSGKVSTPGSNTFSKPSSLHIHSLWQNASQTSSSSLPYENHSYMHFIDNSCSQPHHHIISPYPVDGNQPTNSHLPPTHVHHTHDLELRRAMKQCKDFGPGTRGRELPFSGVGSMLARAWSMQATNAHIGAGWRGRKQPSCHWGSAVWHVRTRIFDCEGRFPYLTGGQSTARLSGRRP